MDKFTLIFAICSLLNLAITLCSFPKISNFFVNLFGELDSSFFFNESGNIIEKGHDRKLVPISKQSHASLLIRYFSVYLLATLSDWLQGPYVYALYDAYGFSEHAIAVLFVAGFGSSMVFGSFFGGMADAYGRRKFVIVYCTVYAASCFTKHFNNFGILILGRVLSGVATSLLYSVFDSWLIRAHSIKALDKQISSSFASVSYGNSIIAIIAGLLANKAANMNDLTALYDATDGVETGVSNGNNAPVMFYGGFLNPFDIAFVSLYVCGFMALLLWDENYGDQSSDSTSDDNDKVAPHRQSNKGIDTFSGFNRALSIMFGNSEILLCGIISSLFEGSMYVFVFMWTPALKSLNTETELPFGVIFSTFMVCCMAGSSLFSLCISKNIKGEYLAVIVFSVSSISMAIIALKPLESDAIVFLAMNAFEMCVGMYFPIMGTLKSAIVPESYRAAIYNIYRVPLNAIVLLSLLTNLNTTQSFMLNTFMLGTAALLQYRLSKKRLYVVASKVRDSTEVEMIKDTEVKTQMI